MHEINPEDAFLLALLMDANQRADGWQEFLETFRLHFDLHSCHLYIENSHAITPYFHYWAGIEDSEVSKQQYIEKNFIDDWACLGMAKDKPNAWFASNLISYYEKTKTIPDFAQYGIEHIGGSTVFSDDAWSCTLIHTRSAEQGGYLQSEIDRFLALSIYIEKAVRLRIYLSNNRSHCNRLKAILNQFHLPVATLNEFGEVVAQNTLMDSFIEENRSLILTKNKFLSIDNVVANRMLQSNIQEIISFSKNPTKEQRVEAISISPKKDAPYILGFQELLAKDDETGDVFVGAMVFAVSSGLISNVSKHQIQTLFSLTNAESQVAYLFSQFMNLKEVARHEDKSIATVREQIQYCYKKTNTKSQLELINLLASLPVSK